MRKSKIQSIAQEIEEEWGLKASSGESSAESLNKLLYASCKKHPQLQDYQNTDTSDIYYFTDGSSLMISRVLEFLANCKWHTYTNKEK